MTAEPPVGPDGKPLERRKEDKVLGKKVEDAVNKRMNDLEGKFTKLFVSAAVFLVVGTLVIGIIFKIQGNQADAIQDGRYKGYVESCDAQNERNRKTIDEINKSDQPQESKDFRIVLVNNLQPNLGDCKDYAAGKVDR